MKMVLFVFSSALALSLNFSAFAKCDGPFTDRQIEYLKNTLHVDSTVIVNFCQYCGHSPRPPATASEPFKMKWAIISPKKIVIDGLRVDLATSYYLAGEQFNNIAASMPAGGHCEVDQWQVRTMPYKKPYDGLVDASLASAKKWIDQAGDCTSDLKDAATDLRADLLEDAFHILSPTSNPAMKAHQDAAGLVQDSPYYRFVSVLMRQAEREKRPYCALATALDVPPSFAEKARIQSQNASGPVIAVAKDIAKTSVTGVTTIADIEKKNFLVSGRDLTVLRNYDQVDETAYSDTGECYFEYSPSADFLSAQSPLNYAIDPNADVILKSGEFIPGLKIVNNSPGISSPICEAVNERLRAECEQETKRNLVWFSQGRMIFTVVDSKGNPIRAMRTMHDHEAVAKYQGNVELTVYSRSGTEAIKCLISRNFALIDQPSDTRQQAAQLSLSLIPDKN
jgi:hypothetical protein